MARLDRLAPAKEVAQIAAVIGREFSHDLLGGVAGLEAAELDHALDASDRGRAGLPARRRLPRRPTASSTPWCRTPPTRAC